MKRIILIGMIGVFLVVWPSARAEAQIEIIVEVIKQAIMAVDLGVQKLQTQTIHLQTIQKTVENTMQQWRLNDITDWVQRQKGLYEGYYQELWQVKNALSYYGKVKDMLEKQAQLVRAYKRAFVQLRKDTHFSAAELDQLYRVYQGIEKESIENVRQLELVVSALLTQMNDADRLLIIDRAAAQIDRSYYDLEAYTQENILISLQRAKDQQDLDAIRLLYGIK